MRTTGPVTDASGTSNAGSATAALPAHNARSFLMISNPSDTDMWVSFTGAAAANAAGSWKLPTLQGYVFDTCVPNNAVSIFCASAKAYTINWMP